MRALKAITAFLLAALFSGVLSSELSTIWINHDVGFLEGRGASWIAQIVISAMVLGILAMAFHFLPIKPSALRHLFGGGLANAFILLCLAVADQDALLLIPDEIVSALLFGALTGLIWFLIKRFIDSPGNASHV